MKALAIHIKVTKAFIDFNPTELILSRRQQVTDTKGGYTLGPVTELEKQWCRVVGQSAKNQDVSPNGPTQIDTVVVVGLPDMDIRPKDKFLWEAQKYEVTTVEKAPAWAIRAKAELRG